MATKAVHSRLNILAAMDDHFIQSPEPVGDHRNFNMAAEWLAAYNRMYKKELFDILKLHDGRSFVERSFLRPFAFINQSGQLVPLTGSFAYLKEFTTQEFVTHCKEKRWIPVLYSGRIDLGVKDSGEWVLDHKTAYQFGKAFQLEMASTPQMRGYCWEFKHYYGRMPKGYIINAMRVRPPVKGAEYDPSLLFRTDGKDPDFVRLPFPVTEQDITEWEQNTFALIDELLWCAQRPHYPKHKKNCVGKYGPCQFYELCNNVDPLHRDSYLASPVFMDNTWSALNKPETAKED